jgi:hypothetical protein
MNQIKDKTYTAKSGKTYNFDIERQTRTDYAEFMNPATKYERVYFQVNVYDTNGKSINFGFVNDENDVEAIFSEVERIDEWVHTPAHVLESMHSRFD